MPLDTENFNIVTSATQYKKKSFENISIESHDIDTNAAAKEILIWINNNVEQFIDNQKRLFKLDLIIDAEDGASETMPNVRKLQDLFRAIPEDPEIPDPKNISDKNNKLIESIRECREHLNYVSELIEDKMKNHKELLGELFKRMGFYYEMKGINDGNILLEELNGEVAITKFEYESFPVGVKVRSPITETQQEDGTIKKAGGVVVSEYVIPEGFTIWLEIAFKAKQAELCSMF